MIGEAKEAFNAVHFTAVNVEAAALSGISGASYDQTKDLLEKIDVVPVEKLKGDAQKLGAVIADVEMLAVGGVWGVWSESEVGSRALGDAVNLDIQPKLSTIKQLRNFGLDASQRRAFYKGSQVIFEDPSTKFPTATIFQFDGNTLRAGIYDLVSDGDTNALFSFVSRSRSLTNSLGVPKLELYGADIQNPRLVELLAKRGFEPGANVRIDTFGFEKDVPTLRKLYDLTLKDEYPFKNQ